MEIKEASEKEFGDARKRMEENYIVSEELNKMLASENPPIVIDLRDYHDDADKKIEGSVKITMQDLVNENLEKIIPIKSTPIVLICNQSFQLTRMMALTTYAYPTLKLMGYTHVQVLRDWDFPF